MPAHNHSGNTAAAGNHSHTTSFGRYNTGGHNCIGNDGGCHNLGWIALEKNRQCKP